MASYLDLRNQFSNSELRNRVTTAVTVAAYNLLQGAPTANDRAWARSVFESPDNAGRVAFMAVLAANKDATIAQIDGATDAAIQTQVDAVVPSLVLALSGA